MKPELFPAGSAIELFSDGIPGFGSLRGMFLCQEGYGGGHVSVTKDITRHGGEVRLPSGRLLHVTLRDVLWLEPWNILFCQKG